MYRHPKFLEVLHDIREEMSREANYDILRLAEIARNGETQAQERGEAKDFDEVQNFKDRKSKTEDQNLIYGNHV